MKTLTEVKNQLLKDKATQKAYAALEDEFTVAILLIAARAAQHNRHREHKF